MTKTAVKMKKTLSWNVLSKIKINYIIHQALQIEIKHLLRVVFLKKKIFVSI